MDTKVTRACRRCGEDKPIEQFTKAQRCKFGRAHTCRACTAAIAQEWAEKNRAQSREIKRKWRSNNPQKQRTSEASYRDSHRDDIRARSRNYEKKNLDKKRCHKMVHYAIDRGRMVRPTSCPKCGKQKDIHAHHEDYSKPLEVQWLCSTCHVRLHKEIAWVPEEPKA